MLRINKSNMSPKKVLIILSSKMYPSRKEKNSAIFCSVGLLEVQRTAIVTVVEQKISQREITRIVKIGQRVG